MRHADHRRIELPVHGVLPEARPGEDACRSTSIPTRIGLRHPADIGLVGDCTSVLQALLPLLQQKADPAFLEKAQERMSSWNELMEERGTRTDMPMKPQVVTYELNKLLADDAIVSADSGTIATWAARYIEMRGDMQFSLSGSLATMANGLPYSIGAAVAYPGRQVVCIVGDGGLTMLMGEIATLVKYNLNVKVVVIKNNVLGNDQVGADGARRAIRNSASSSSRSISPASP